MVTKRQLVEAYQQVRGRTEELCEPLMVEDYVIQSSDDVSPPKWHLAHTTWFFETFILMSHQLRYTPFNPSYHYLFNSYYQSVGNPYPRTRRGMLSRPPVESIYHYRKHIDEQVIDYINQLSEVVLQTVEPILMLGLQHEQQHQELLLMDIKHNFSFDPTFPVYREAHSKTTAVHLGPIEFTPFEGGIVEIGSQGREFCFDNELPRHQVILKPYLLARRLVINAEYCEFIQAGGYQNPHWWLSDGFDCVQKGQWQAPLYWHQIGGKWYVFTLSGLNELNPTEPVSHISYYEADAYARWRNLRLPLEAEWEHSVASHQVTSNQGNFMEKHIFHPCAVTATNHPIPQQLFGDLWEWTASSYSPYPGYKPLEGALGEYNGKFMSNQFVLRGGCCVTPQSHIRTSYRNFFQPEKRWEFSGIRLACDE